MAAFQLNNMSTYAGKCIVLTTKHAKSIAISTPFWDKLKASVLEYVVDTDKLGTFSGEVARIGTALECARKKCEWSIEQLGSNVEFALASEGSFGPHPFIPYLASDHEILYFIDRKHDFHLHLSCLSEKTNYRMQSIDSIDKLRQFASDTLFPSHALILRPNDRKEKQLVFKGIVSETDLISMFAECQKYSSDGKVWVETDMRAQFNPSRMIVIRNLAMMLAERLATKCLNCNTPGWGKIRQEPGLACEWCGLETTLAKADILACVKCDYEVIAERVEGLQKADPYHCQYCNP